MGPELILPSALLLAGLLGGVVLAHLAKQVPRERKQHGAMLLLRRLSERLRRRHRVRDRRLMAVRLLALAMLVLAASGLEWVYPGDVPEHGGSGRVVWVVDRSMSMQLESSGESLLQRARREALEALDRMPEGTWVGLVSYADQATRHTQALTQDRDVIRRDLETLTPTFGSSDLRSALLEARGLLGGEPGEVLVWTDEAGPRQVLEAAPEIERLVEVGTAIIPRVVHSLSPKNMAVTTAAYGEGIEGGHVTFGLKNFGPEPMEVTCEVRLPGGDTVTVFVEVEPGALMEEQVTVPRKADGGVGVVVCEDPALLADNRFAFHLPQVGASRVLVVDGDPGDTPTRSEVYFLERALSPWGGVHSGVSVDVVSPAGLQALDPEEHRVVFLANVSDPKPFAARLIDFIRQGGNVVLGGGENVTPERYNVALSSVLPSPIRGARSVTSVEEGGTALAVPDLDTELFEPFQDVGSEGFSRVASHKLLMMESFQESENVEVLLSYEGGLPALVERRVGGGRLILWTSTFDLGWSNLPIQSSFMPLVQRLVSYLGAEASMSALTLDAVVGERVTVPLPDLVLDLKVWGPDGEEVVFQRESSQLRFVPERPGGYLVAADAAPPLAHVAVNVDSSESDIHQYGSIVEVERTFDPTLLERRVDLTRTLLALAMALFLIQGVMALRRPES
jgi:hypothetical protein